MRSFSRSLLLLCLFATVIGCADDSPAEPAATVQWKKPAAGSTFTYTGFSTDSTGREIGGSRDRFTDSVIATGVAAHGRTGLNRMSYLGFFQILVDYRANGDFAMAFEEDDIDFPWTVLPVASRGTVNHEAWSYSEGDSTSQLTWSTPYMTVSYMGAEQLATDAGILVTHRILSRSFDTTSSGDPYIQNDTAWYAPALGTYVRQSRPADMVKSKTGITLELTGYTLK